MLPRAAERLAAVQKSRPAVYYPGRVLSGASAVDLEKTRGRQIGAASTAGRTGCSLLLGCRQHGLVWAGLRQTRILVNPIIIQTLCSLKSDGEESNLCDCGLHFNRNCHLIYYAAIDCQ
jgi:hypothetical protein